MNNIRNQLVIGERERGKTTYLFDKVCELFTQGENIIILDSAVMHKDKSLQVKVINNFTNVRVIEQKNPDCILKSDCITDFLENTNQYFPFNENLSQNNSILSFDLSFFLEEGHRIYAQTKSLDHFLYYRRLYQFLSFQIITALLIMDKKEILPKTFIIMDEVELPELNVDVLSYQNNSRIISAIHPVNTLNCFYNNFEILYKD